MALVLKHVAVGFFEFLDCRPKLLAQFKQQMFPEPSTKLKQSRHQSVVHIDDCKEYSHRNLACTYRERANLAL
jgi:hypothetical protein